MSENEKSPPLGSEARPGGRPLFAGLAVLSALLLTMIRSQTEPGFDGGDWWNEPMNGPLVSLALMFACSTLAAIFASPMQIPGMLREAFLAILLSALFLAAIWLIPQIGYSLSVLVFATGAGFLAGFRGRKLGYAAIGLTVLMLITFRYVLGLWFPSAALFKLTPWLETIGGYL